MTNLHKYDGESFDKTIYLQDNIEVDPQIKILKSVFPLERYDYDKIINSSSNILKIAELLLGSTIALLINMVSKLIGSKLDDSISFDHWEFYAFIVSLVFMIIFYFINWIIPNERVRIIKKINKHFKEE